MGPLVNLRTLVSSSLLWTSLGRLIKDGATMKRPYARLFSAALDPLK